MPEERDRGRQSGVESPYKGKSGLRRLLNAAGYSVAGFIECARHEDAFRQEILLAAVLVPLGVFLGDGGSARALLVGSVLLVLVVELINSAIEAAVDRISFDDHRLAKRAKDIGSAAVMMSLIAMGVTWLLVLSG